jgi:hypothetical protein
MSASLFSKTISELDDEVFAKISRVIPEFSEEYIEGDFHPGFGFIFGGAATKPPFTFKTK